MVKKKKQRLRAIEKKILKIESDYPNVDFNDLALKKAVNIYFELVKEMRELSVDIKICQTRNSKEMCLNCNCWKSTANRCS